MPVPRLLPPLAGAAVVLAAVAPAARLWEKGVEWGLGRALAHTALLPFMI